MKLDFSLIATALCGAERFVEHGGLLFPCRFTEAECEAYKGYSADFYMKTRASAGMRLEFSTDSTAITLSGECRPASSRCFFGFDVYADGALIHHTLDYIKDGRADYRIEVSLGEKKQRRIKIYFPWSVETAIAELSIDDGAGFTPIRHPKAIVCYGDSITHGYDSVNPSFSYANRLADMLLSEPINKGIGGEVFFPTLAELAAERTPDYITVAYGTNDWSITERERFDKNSRLFYDNLAKKYPNAKIFALAPIWRINCESRITSVGEFTYVSDTLREIAASYDNITFIEGIDLVPKSAEYYAPDILHPNDAGFYHYAANLYSEIKKHI